MVDDLEPAGASVGLDAAGAVAWCVVDEVRHDAFKEPGIGHDRRQRVEDVDLHAVPAGHTGGGSGDDLVQPYRREAHRQGPGAQAGRVEQVADQPLQPVGGVLDRLQELGVLLRCPRDVGLP